MVVIVEHISSDVRAWTYAVVRKVIPGVGGGSQVCGVGAPLDVENLPGIGFSAGGDG